MAKKRKTASAPAQAAPSVSLDVGTSKKRIRDYKDVADSDDEFHDARDQILLDDGPEAKKRRKWEDEEEFLQPSDEEVLAYSDSENESDHEPALGAANRLGRDNDNADEDNEETGLGWGTSRADLYGADDIETEEQALEEEAEALRLQKKQLRSMTAADYGFDESEWQASNELREQPEDNEGVVTQVLPQLHISKDLSQADRLQLLHARYPEFEPLSKEFVRMKAIHSDLSKDCALERPNSRTKLVAATSYLGALTMYFMLLTSTASEGASDTVALSAAKLHEHAVMDTLVQTRQIWQKTELMPDSEEELESDEDEEVDATIESVLDLDEASSARRAVRPSRAQRHAAAAQARADAARKDRLKRTEADLRDIDALLADGSGVASTRQRFRADGHESDLGDEAPLTAHEAAEKAKRKKSLRFYTSQIAQKANKRGASGRNAGGDDDIPYRERLRDRQARLNAEAAKRGRHDAGDDLGGDSDEDDVRQAQQIRAAADEDDYYDLVAARTAKKKSDKAALSAAQKEAALQGGRVVEEETVGADGKRKISYMIEKNKGLTPFRKKDVRNPRVKKRRKYDEKKKKLASIKAVYKGGEGRGGYGGELTGIKKGLVKSTKL